MAAYLRAHGIRLFDDARFAEPLREEIRQNAERLAREHGPEIEFIRAVHAFRKDERIRALLAQRGPQPGLVHLFAALEPCTAFMPWHDKTSGRTTLRYKDGTCLHYYFSLIDPEFGLCYLRGPTWAPFRLQFYCNGHNWLIGQLRLIGIIFHRQDDLRPLYDTLVRTAVHAVKHDHVAILLGRTLTGHYQDERGNDFHTRVEGTRLKHHMGPVALKLYDKQALVLRIETTVSDVSFFQHHRTVAQRDGTSETKHAPMRKSLYSLTPLRALLFAANRRYLAFLSDLADPSAGVRPVERLAEPIHHEERSYRHRGFNLCSSADLTLFTALARGEWQISGVRNASLRRVLPQYSGPRFSRVLKRLHVHGLIKTVGHTYKYYLTHAGQQVVLTALKLRELVIIPSLAGLLPAA